MDQRQFKALRQFSRQETLKLILDQTQYPRLRMTLGQVMMLDADDVIVQQLVADKCLALYEPPGAESPAIPPEDDHADDLGSASYEELQEHAKNLGIPAVGKREVLEAAVRAKLLE